MKVVTVSNDMTRYIRDVIVAIRTHEAVFGGLTARAALDLEAIMKYDLFSLLLLLLLWIEQKKLLGE
jgi:hypothetical protein